MRAAALIALLALGAAEAHAANVTTPSDVNMMASLGDGRVVLAGGNAPGAALATCVAFDPDSGAWSALEDLAHGRARGTLTLLADGSLLAVGGIGAGANVAAAERWSPTTGHWRPDGAQPIATQQHTATRLADGRVIVIGGLTGANLSTSQVLRFDPATGQWASRAAMIHPRHDQVAVLLTSRKILCIGGYVNGAGGGPSATVDLYDPATNSWSNATPMSRARYDHSAALLPDGSVAVFAGSPSTSPATMEIYHPSTDTWSAPTAMPHDHVGVNALTLYDGEVLLVGGGSTGDLYDPVSATWSSPACIALSQYRTLHPAGIAGDGRAVIAAGVGTPGLLGDAEVFGQHLGFAAIPAHHLGDPPIALSASSSAGLPVTFRVLSGPATVSGSTLTITGAGTVVVRAEQAGDPTWFPAARVRSFTVAPVSGGLAAGSATGGPVSGAIYGDRPTNGTTNFFCGLGSGGAATAALAIAALRRRERRR